MKNLLALTFGCVALAACGENAAMTLPATAFTLASGNPSVQTWYRGETALPVWSFSGGQKGQSVSAVTPPLPAEARGVKIELLVVNEEAGANDSFFDVWRTDVTELADGMPATRGKPLRSRLAPKPWQPRWIVTESFLVVRGGAPLAVRVAREPGDAGDTFERPAGLLQVRVTPLAAPPKPVAVESRPGYNSWPMIQSVNGRLVCLYSRGLGHTIGDGERDAYARTSLDGGKTWQNEIGVARDPLVGEVAIGKGADLDGAALFWVRCMGRPRSHHDLYRTRDGMTFEKIAEPALDPFPMQITDVFHVEGRRLMALWFATNYQENGPHAWGTLTSDDNGCTWKQTTIERVAKKGELPTEPCVVNLGGGRLLGLARTEVGGDSTASEFQLTSTDNGATWQKTKTNIRDINISSPSLIYDAATKRLFAYYYERGRHVVKRRVVDADFAFAHPLDWPAPEGLFIGDEERPHDAGNVNAAEMNGQHYLTYYSGTRSQATIYVGRAP